MSNAEESKSKEQLPYFDPSLVIDTRLSEIERQQREDKAEQRKHARSQRVTNWLLTVFTGLLFFTSVGSDVLLLRQTSITKESADAAKRVAETSAKELELTQRPWVKVQATISGPLTFDSNGVSVSLLVAISNIGRTPAMGLWVYPKLILGQPKADPVRDRASLCEDAASLSSIIGYTLYPNDKPFEQGWTFSASKTEIAEALKNIPFLVPIALVCVGYHPYFNEKTPYFTGVTYTIEQPRPDNPRLLVLMQPGKNIPAVQLRATEDWIAPIIVK